MKVGVGAKEIFITRKGHQISPILVSAGVS